MVPFPSALPSPLGEDGLSKIFPFFSAARLLFFRQRCRIPFFLGIVPEIRQQLTSLFFSLRRRAPSRSFPFPSVAFFHGEEVPESSLWLLEGRRLMEGDALDFLPHCYESEPRVLTRSLQFLYLEDFPVDFPSLGMPDLRFPLHSANSTLPQGLIPFPFRAGSSFLLFFETMPLFFFLSKKVFSSRRASFNNPSKILPFSQVRLFLLSAPEICPFSFLAGSEQKIFSPSWLSSPFSIRIVGCVSFFSCPASRVFFPIKCCE